jgi:phenylalanyl-tRNA synthetase alpha chain
MSAIEELDDLQTHALTQLAVATDQPGLLAWKNAYLGKQSELMRFSQRLGALPAEQRRDAGQRFNAIRQTLEQALAAAQEQLTHSKLTSALEAERTDVTLSGRASALGRFHPIMRALAEVIAAFGEMGFQVWESPDVETDEYNFGLLNMPADHPARDMHDTFYVETPPDAPRMVLRTHTSPGQIHAMRASAPNPVRMILPGRCHRNEDVTARHEMMFTQFEFLAVGHGITMAHMKGTLSAMAKRLFGPDTQVRLRASYFPFTEPSAELDVSCFLCNGAGCRMCKYSNWLELGGCGMVHPTVLRNGGYDPAEFSGFAGGFGADRVAILKYGIDDIRWFYSGDERFLQQFG